MLCQTSCAAGGDSPLNRFSIGMQSKRRRWITANNDGRELPLRQGGKRPAILKRFNAKIPYRLLFATAGKFVASAAKVTHPLFYNLHMVNTLQQPEKNPSRHATYGQHQRPTPGRYTVAHDSRWDH